MENTTQIFYDSPEAAQKVILNLEDGTRYGSGWVSNKRQFYTTESQARNDGATHKKCECGDIIEIGKYCEKCAFTRRRDAYYKKPEKDWDGTSMLTLHDDDRFFRDMDEVGEYCADNEINPSDLMLVICEPNYLYDITTEYWEDIAPEDDYDFLPKEVEIHLKALNEAIHANKTPISWNAGTYRTKYTS